jgi:hypothetical protein
VRVYPIPVVYKCGHLCGNQRGATSWGIDPFRHPCPSCEYEHYALPSGVCKCCRWRHLTSNKT